MFYTTLNAIREQDPCREGWRRLLGYLGKAEADDEPLSFKTILGSNGLDYAICVLRCIEETPEVRLFAVRCVRQVQHMIKNTDFYDALDIAERYAVGDATDEELEKAYQKANSANCSYTASTLHGALHLMSGICVTTASVEATYWESYSSAFSVARWVAWAYAYDACVKYGIYESGEVYNQVWSKAYAKARDDQEKDFIAIFCSDDRLKK